MKSPTTTATTRPARIRQITPQRLELLAALLDLFGKVFAEPGVYNADRPDADYLRTLLGGENFIALAALDGDKVVGGLAAYVLPKFEQARHEVHIYDLAVDAAYRRRGTARAPLDALLEIAGARGAWLVFVQAYQDADSAPAVALYSQLGRREAIWHFEIEPDAGDR